jgi:hypothetical protein
MSEKHTPGPWEAVPDHAQTLKEAQPYDPPWVRAGMRPVAVCHNGGSWGTVAESEANAALIAAAPDLAEGCRMALNHLVAWHTGEFDREKEMLRAALAKAEGR